MKENTKYHDYLFNGKIIVDEIQPWFDFGTGKPWDDDEIPWVLDNKVRREILIILSSGPKTLKEIHKRTNFSPNSLLINPETYQPKVKYQWTEATIRNHLMNLEWYNLIKSKENKYELTFPIFDEKEVSNLDQFVLKFAKKWMQVIFDTKEQLQKAQENLTMRTELLEILIAKAVDKLYEQLKEQGLLPNEPNLKKLWAEQIRAIKFEEWLKKSF
jgi:hypothetical protein